MEFLCILLSEGKNDRHFDKALMLIDGPGSIIDYREIRLNLPTEYVGLLI